MRARDAAAKFIEANVKPNRPMAIANFTGSLQIAQNFTDDVERLKQVVAGVSFATVTPNGGYASLGGRGGFGDVAGFGQRSMLMAVRTLARNMADVPGRKIMVLFGGGFPLTLENRSELTAAIDACNKANVSIYPIDVYGLSEMPADNPRRMELRMPGGGAFRLPAGLGGMVNSFAQSRGGGGGGMGDNTGTAPTGRYGVTYPSTIPSLNQNNRITGLPRTIVPPLPPSATTNQEVLYALADGTGGFVIVNTNDLLGGLDKIGKEQNEYYLIGYTPPDSAEGTCHSLKVNVEHGYSVRARSGYCNVKQADVLAGKPQERELETRAAANVQGDIKASMMTPFFYTSSNTARMNVAMDIPTDSLKIEKVKGKLHLEMSVLGLAHSSSGATAARFSDSVTKDFVDKKDVEAFQKHPFHYENQFDIGSGSYNLTVVFSTGGESFGKIEQPVTVDAYDAKQLFISGLALSKEFHRISDADTQLDSVLLEGRAPLVVQGVRITPAGDNRFKKTDTAVVYLEVYEPALAEASATPAPASGAAKPNAQAGAAPAVAAAAPAKPALRVVLQMRLLDRNSGEQKADPGWMEVTNAGKPGNNRRCRWRLSCLWVIWRRCRARFRQRRLVHLQVNHCRVHLLEPVVARPCNPDSLHYQRRAALRAEPSPTASCRVADAMELLAQGQPADEELLGVVLVTVTGGSILPKLSPPPVLKTTVRL